MLILFRTVQGLKLSDRTPNRRNPKVKLKLDMKNEKSPKREKIIMNVYRASIRLKYLSTFLLIRSKTS